MPTNRNKETLQSFVEYCFEHPTERFWQALRNWADVNYLFVADTHEADGVVDTFYWEGKNK